MPCEVVRWLLAAGASLEHRNAEGLSHHAALCRAGRIASCSSVLACGRSMQPNHWNMTEAFVSAGMSPLMAAAAGEQSEVPRF